MAKSDKPGDESPAPLGRFIPYRFARISEALSRSTSRRYTHYGVSPPEWRVLAVLTDYGVASSKFVQEHTSLSKSRVNRTLGSLVAKGFVARQIESADKRQNKISLTPAGTSIFRKVGKIAQDTQDEWLDSLTDAEISILHQLLDKLEKNIPAE
jgi:DNA-binding MarR family transcriptional regulator